MNETVIVDTDSNKDEGEDKEVVNSDNNLETGASNGEGVGSIGDLVGQSRMRTRRNSSMPRHPCLSKLVLVQWEVRYDQCTSTILDQRQDW